jgi:hypothetical protein
VGTKKYELPKPETDTMLWHHVVEGPEVLWLERGTDGHLVIRNVNRRELGPLDIGPVHEDRARRILKAKPGKVLGLLLKTRRGKTASFSVSDWSLVCDVVGFDFKVEKEDREIAAVTVTTPHAGPVRIEREPGYRSIPFYHFEDEKREFRGGLVEWTKHVNESIADLAAQALCLPTHEQENRLREYKARDWSHTGTCGVCELNVKMTPEKKLVHHGYRRPGHGSIEGDCFGVGKPPHELSPEAAEGWLDVLRRELRGLRLYLQQLTEGEVEEVPKSAYDFRAGMVRKGQEGWDRALEMEIDSTRTRLRHVEGEEARFSKKVGTWEPDELPEVKLRKLEEHVAAMIQRRRRGSI